MILGRLRALGVGVAVLLVTVGAPASATAGGGLRAQVWVFDRISPDAGSVTVYMRVNSGQGPSVLALAYERRTGSSTTTLPDASLYSDPGVSGAAAFTGRTTVTCPSHPTCETGQGNGYDFLLESYSDHGSADPLAPTRILAIVYGPKPEVEETAGAGRWRVHRQTRSVELSWADGSSDGSGASDGGYSAEVFRSASQPGYRRGSLAIAQPPCVGVDGASGGLGSATLTGGRSPVTTTCPTDNGFALSDIAASRTYWNFTGVIAGVGDLGTGPGPCRLLVLDGG